MGGGIGVCIFCEYCQLVWGWFVKEELVRCFFFCWSVKGMQIADSSGFFFVSVCVYGGEQL